MIEVQMKCAYPECPNDVPEPRGKRQYCSNAHKQADYRRRKAKDSGTIASGLDLDQALTRISTLEQLVEALEAKTSGLDRRLQDLEKQAEVHHPVEPAQELASSDAVPTREVQTQYHDIVSIPVRQSDIAFFLPDFSQPLQEGYWCDAVEQDVRAWLAVLPERSVPHGYYLTQKMWDKVNPVGKTGHKQEQRAKDLLARLSSHVEEMMRVAGWTIMQTTGQGTQVWGLASTLESRGESH